MAEGDEEERYEMQRFWWGYWIKEFAHVEYDEVYRALVDYYVPGCPPARLRIVKHVVTVIEERTQ